MLRKLKVRVRGMVPLLMHNGALADPLNEHAKAMKKITSKRKKTDDDLVELARLEFMGGLYVDENKEPCVPGDVIEGFFGSAAKTLRLGKQGKSGVYSDGLWPLIYEGPRSPEKMWADGRFRDSRGAKVQASRVMRTRPIFRKWKLEFELIHDTEILDVNQIGEILKAGATTHGLCDYIPKFGRFITESVKDLGPVALA